MQNQYIQNAALLTVKADGSYSYRSTFKGQTLLDSCVLVFDVELYHISCDCNYVTFVVRMRRVVTCDFVLRR
jgi:hypothetical protein